MLLAGDERRHNNPDLAYVDAEFMRGGGRVTATLATLVTDFANKPDQLKENVTLVYVISENAAYRLKSIANISTLDTGWKKDSVDISITAKNLGDNNFVGNQTITGIVTATTRTASANLPQNASGNTLFSGGNFNAHVSNNDYLNYGSRPTFGFTIDGLYGAGLYLRSNTEQEPLYFEVQDINGKTDRLALVSMFSGYMSKESGKGLSSNDYTTTEVNKVANLPADTGAALAAKVDKVAGKVLTDQNYSLTEKNRLAAILTGFNILFTAPRRDLPPVYLDKTTKVIAINLSSATAVAYSINGGASYITPALPLTADTAITLPVGWAKFRITFTSNSVDASAYLKIE